MAHESDGKVVLVKYHYPDDYAPQYASGAWGGLTPNGEICVHFFFDRPPLPREQKFELLNQQLGRLVETQPIEEGVAGVALRTIVGGVTMSPETARAVITFLEAKLAEYQSAKQSLAQSKH
jgi:hypothetical protein